MTSITSPLLAMNAQRQFNIVVNRQKKTSEHLSSGYKINRAADDAAGLTISEKMRSQIRALNQDCDNVQDGISLCQVADGALTEVHDMLHRMEELTIKSSNGTNTSADRKAIQKEINSLIQEIDRVGDATEFNNMKLFFQPYMPGVSGRPNDIQIFNSTDNNGNQTYGGIIHKGTRYTWNDISADLLQADGTFKGGTYDFTTNDGVSITFLAKDGAQPPQIERKYTMTAGENGITVDKTLIPWSDIIHEGGTTTSHFGSEVTSSSYSFDFEGMNISFEPNQGDSIDDIIKGLNGDGITAYTWKSVYTPPVGQQAVDLVSVNNGNIRVTEANKNYIKNGNYTIGADQDGIYITNSAVGLSKDNSLKTWNDLGITSWDSGNSINKNALYTYEDSASGLNFNFTILDEVSKEEVINGLNGVNISCTPSSSDRVTSSLSSGNGYLISATISQYQKPFNYETEKEYGRNFDTENAAYLTGTVQYTGAELSLSLNGSNGKSIAFSTADSNDIINLKTSISNSINQYIQNIYNKSCTDIISGNIPDITSVTGNTGSQVVGLNTAVYPMFLNLSYDVSSIKDHISVSAQEKESGNYVKNDSGIGYQNYNASRDAGKTRYEIMLEKDSGYTSQVDNIMNGVLKGMNQFSVAVTSKWICHSICIRQ